MGASVTGDGLSQPASCIAAGLALGGGLAASGESAPSPGAGRRASAATSC